MRRIAGIVSFVALLVGAAYGQQTAEVAWAEDPERCRANIQGALDEGGRVVLENVGRPWKIGATLWIRSNTVLVLEPGVELLASEQGFREINACLIRVVGVHDVEISGAGATIRMQRDLYARLGDSQFRHAVRVSKSENVYIHGAPGKMLEVRESGGDGIYIGGGGYGPSRNVTIRYVWCDRNYREGFGVMSVGGGLIEHCLATNTKGSPPGNGFNIEPNHGEPLDPPQRLRVVVRDCEMSGNAGAGLHVNLSQSNPGLVANVLIDRCTLRDNCKSHNVSDVFCDGRDRDGDGHYATGLVVIRNCRIAQGVPDEMGNEDFGRWGLLLVMQQDVPLTWVFVGNSWSSPNGVKDTLLRVRLPRVETPNPLGGVLFVNCAVDDGLRGPRQPVELVPYREGTTGVYNVRGELRYSYRLALR